MYTTVSRNEIWVLEISKSNLIDSCLVFRSAIKLIKLVSGKVQMRKISSINLQYIKQSANICG